MPAFKLQTKDSPRAKWRDIRFARPYADLESAIAGACALDQDGLFSSTIRVVCGDAVAATHKTVRA